MYTRQRNEIENSYGHGTRERNCFQITLIFQTMGQFRKRKALHL